MQWDNAVDGDPYTRRECCGNPLRTGREGRGCANCPPVKLTFEEWFNDRCGGDTYTQQEDIKSRMEWAWQAAQENK